MHCRVAERFEYCVTGGKVILLDLQSNRYLALPTPGEAAFLALLDQGGEADRHDPIISGLMRQGLIEETGEPGLWRREAVIESVSTDLPTSGTARVRLVFSAMAWQLRWEMRLRTRRFAQLVSALRNGGVLATQSEPHGLHQIAHVAAAFERTDRYLGRADRCLVRSLAMFSLFRSFGISVNLVIGVRSGPFTAHCWIQRSGMVLNDSAEHARNFTPILVL